MSRSFGPLAASFLLVSFTSLFPASVRAQIGALDSDPSADSAPEVSAFELVPAESFAARCARAVPGARAGGVNDPLAPLVVRGLGASRVRIARRGLPVFDFELPGLDGPPLDSGARIVPASQSPLVGVGAIAATIELPVLLLPDSLGAPLDVRFGTYGATAAHAGGATLSLAGTRGELGWTAAAIGRRSGAITSPAGDIDSRSLEAWNGSAAFGWRGAPGRAEVDYARFGGRFDRPLTHGPASPAPGAVTRLDRDLDDHQLQLLGGTRFAGLDFELIGQWQRHRLDAELADASRPRLSMVLKSYASELRARRDLGRWEVRGGAFGLAHSTRTRTASPIVPDARTLDGAFYGSAGYRGSSWRLAGEVRLDARHLEAHDEPSLALATQSRTFDDGSFGLGAVWTPSPTWRVDGSLGRVVRTPSLLELYAHGPDPIADRYLIGDRHLPNERGVALDLGATAIRGPWTARLAAFGRRIGDFVDFDPTGETIDGLPVHQYAPRTARFWGGEAALGVRAGGILRESDVFAARATRLELSLSVDAVNGEDLTRDRPLSQMPPPRWLFDVVWRHAHGGTGVQIAAGIEGHARPTRLGARDVATAPFALAHFGGELIWRSVRFGVAVTNATDARARDFLSPDPALAPEAGRSFAARLSWDS